MDFRSGTQSISWFRDLHRRELLTLKPGYQRNPVWMARQKCYLIESILEGLPIPEVFVQVETSSDGDEQYAVVDGQQRIRAILQFIGADGDPDQDEFDQFALDKLPVTSTWYGLTFAELTSDQRQSFFSYLVSVRHLVSATDDEVKDMFRRLNKFTSPLKPAELRNATYAGPFAKMALKFSDDFGDFLTENRIITAASIRRMADVEFFAELVIGALHGPQGGSAKVIDDYYQQYEDSEDEFPREREVRRLMPKAINLAQLIVPDLRETRWSNKSDFYSLMVALIAALKRDLIRDTDAAVVAVRLADLARDVENRLEDDEARVPEAAAAYARAVSRGANEKSRRSVRHEVLLSIFSGDTAEPVGAQEGMVVR